MKIIINPNTWEMINNHVSILESFKSEEKDLSKKWNMFYAYSINKIISTIRRFDNLFNQGSWQAIHDVLDAVDEGNFKTFSKGRWGCEFIAACLEEYGLLGCDCGIDNMHIFDEGKLLLEFLKDFGFQEGWTDCNATDHQPFWSRDVEFTLENDKSYEEWRKEYEIQTP